MWLECEAMEVEASIIGEMAVTTADQHLQIQEVEFHEPAVQVGTQLNLDSQNLNIAISVQGAEYKLPDFAIAQLQISIDLANKYKSILSVGVNQNQSGRELSSHLSDLILSFSRSAAEAAALADADDYKISEEVLDRDIIHLKQLGSFTALVDFHNAKQKETGLNVDRVREHLSMDPNYGKIYELVDHGVVIDTASDFTAIHRTAKFRNLQLRMLPVHRKAVVDMHGKNKVLLFRIADIPLEIYDTLHTANEYHWRPEPGKIAGRPLLDCSNCALGEIPLNSEETKELGIKRYQKVHLPTFKEVMVAWDNYRIDNALQWKDMWIFKADISGCFNQLHWSQESVRLMGFVLQAGILMIMLTCGFGVGVTPMVWSLIGDAMNRVINAVKLCTVFTFVDDYFGAGSLRDALASQEISHDTIRGVVGYEGLSVKKNVFSQTAEILGILVNCVEETVRPKDKALDKLFFVLFSIDIMEPQSLQYWQCLSSLVNVYSPYLRGMRPFVAAINHMTRKANMTHKAMATPSASFAVAMWRAALVICMADPEALSVPILVFVRNPRVKRVHPTVSDASPWRLCAALYHPITFLLLCWATLRLPYAKDVEGRSQGHREYLGFLFSTLMVVRYAKSRGIPTDAFQYQWINDNMGALQWASKNKCSSLASQLACMAVSQIHMLSNIFMEDPDHLPGVAMGEIDSMSRMGDGETLESDRIQRVCPSLTPSLQIQMEDPLIMELFVLCDPSRQLLHEHTHHAAFERVFKIVHQLIV